MINPHASAGYPSPLPDSATGTDAELDRRLGLYRVFLKLYEHHRNLLDEILDLEHSSGQCQTRVTFYYVQAILNGQQAYLTTNLVEGKTQAVHQPQMVWTIGRNRRLALPISDKRLSRLHAVLQYIPDRGFYLVDLNSTNGSYVNGEQVRHSALLKDGDRVRLGSLAFNFFVCQNAHTAEAVPDAVLSQLNASAPLPGEIESLLVASSESTSDWDMQLPGDPKDTSMFLKPVVPAKQVAKSTQLSTTQQAEILDRFLSR
jgi:pSer/pThr/pTyr-binding forkhead associated (FHA) protein